MAQLEDGESATFQLVGDPYREATEHSESALHVPVMPVDVPDDMKDMSGDPLDENEEYNIINSSSAFFQALVSAFPAESEDMVGKAIEVEAVQEGDQYSRFYLVNKV